MGRPIGHLEAADLPAPRQARAPAHRARRAGRPAAAVRRGAARGRREPGRDQPARPRHREPPPGGRGRRCTPSWSATSTAAACSRRSTARSRCCPPTSGPASAGSSSTSCGATPRSCSTAPAELERRTRRPDPRGAPVGGRRRPRRRGLPRPAGPARRPPSRGRRHRAVDVAVVRFPHLANATDLDPLAVEPGRRRSLGRPRRWARRPRPRGAPRHEGHRRRPGLAAVHRAWPPRVRAPTAAVLGICGGYQMLGRRLSRPAGRRGPRRRPRSTGSAGSHVDTAWGAEKVTRQRRRHRPDGQPGPRLRDPPRPDDRGERSGVAPLARPRRRARGCSHAAPSAGAPVARHRACTGSSRPTRSGRVLLAAASGGAGADRASLRGGPHGPDRSPRGPRRGAPRPRRHRPPHPTEPP